MIGLALGADIQDLVDRLLAVVGEVEERPVVKPALPEHSQVHLHPDVGLLIGNILHQLGPVPGEYLAVEVRVVAGRFEADDHAFPVLLHIFYEVIYLEGLPADCDDGVVLGVDLPVAVVVVDVEVLDCLLGEALPALQADQQPLDVGVEVREVQVADQVLDLEGVVHYRLHLLPVPLLEVRVLELPGLLGHLLEDAGVVAQRVGDVLEVQEPEAGLEAELVEQEGAEVDVEVAVGVDGQVEVVLGDLDGAVLEEVGVVVLEDLAL